MHFEELESSFLNTNCEVYPCCGRYQYFLFLDCFCSIPFYEYVSIYLPIVILMGNGLFAFLGYYEYSLMWKLLFLKTSICHRFAVSKQTSLTDSHPIFSVC